jgi:intracellular sulfur oxidation DsrE/DsrF family protein
MDNTTNPQRRHLLQRLAGLATLLGTSAAGASATASAPPQERVIYHIDDSARAISALRNITNHLNARPQTKIYVVALSRGIDFLVDGHQDDRGNSYDALVDPLMLRGVEFRVCNNSLLGRHVKPEALLPDVQVVPSGVAEIARLQLQDGCAYIKP